MISLSSKRQHFLAKQLYSENVVKKKKHSHLFMEQRLLICSKGAEALCFVLLTKLFRTIWNQPCVDKGGKVATVLEWTFRHVSRSVCRWAMRRTQISSPEWVQRGACRCIAHRPAHRSDLPMLQWSMHWVPGCTLASIHPQESASTETTEGTFLNITGDAEPERRWSEKKHPTTPCRGR